MSRRLSKGIFAHCSGPRSFSGGRPASSTTRNALRRCLTNLVDNAIKYGRSAEVSIAIENDKVAIRIRDHGGGIPAELLDAVFEPFFRLETSRSRDTGGTGLGLTIARNIAENHGAALTLSNCPDGGLQACLLIPVRPR